jgi:putative membrane protein (TIGR04086 family)
MRKNEEKTNTGRHFLTSILLGAAFGFLISIILFAVFAALIASGKISDGIMTPLTAVVGLVGALLGSVVAVKRHKGRIIAIGAGVGAAMLLVTMIGAVFTDTGRMIGSMTPVLVAVLPGGGIVGALLCLKRKKHKRA